MSFTLVAAWREGALSPRCSKDQLAKVINMAFFHFKFPLDLSFYLEISLPSPPLQFPTSEASAQLLFIKFAEYLIPTLCRQISERAQQSRTSLRNKPSMTDRKLSLMTLMSQSMRGFQRKVLLNTKWSISSVSSYAEHVTSQCKSPC